MLEITTSGTPTTIGLQHGSLATLQISRALIFYAKIFREKANMDWPTVCTFALKYQPYLETSFPAYVEEMKGVAKGAGFQYEDILAMNVRTEIAFGNFSDGCTAMSWKEKETSLLAQNWDWNTEQAENLIILRIAKEDGTRLEMVTEAGIIGKIGMNSHGVGCTLNAIKAKGVSFTKLPCHLALRTVLESKSRADAIDKLEIVGVASACHILVADGTGGTGVECSSEDIIKLEMHDGIVLHTNHYVLPHAEEVVEAHDWLVDTNFRLKRIEELVGDVKIKGPSVQVVEDLLKDEIVGDGAAICRFGGTNGEGLATLFSIVMDLNGKMAKVAVGRPTEATEYKTLRP